MIDRRKFLHGVASLFAGPAILRSGLIMPIKVIEPVYLNWPVITSFMGPSTITWLWSGESARTIESYGFMIAGEPLTNRALDTLLYAQERMRNLERQTQQYGDGGA